MDGAESLCIVKECRELEGRYSVNFTSRVLTTEPNECKSLVKELEKSISQNDFALQVKKASKHHQHLCNIAVQLAGRSYGITLWIME